jgi:hypothetical protein
MDFLCFAGLRTFADFEPARTWKGHPRGFLAGIHRSIVLSTFLEAFHLGGGNHNASFVISQIANRCDSAGRRANRMIISKLIGSK